MSNSIYYLLLKYVFESLKDCLPYVQAVTLQLRNTISLNIIIIEASMVINRRRIHYRVLGSTVISIRTVM